MQSNSLIIIIAMTLWTSIINPPCRKRHQSCTRFISCYAIEI